MLNRKRINARKIITIKNICFFVAFISFLLVFTTIISGKILEKKVAKSTVSFKSNDELKDLSMQQNDNNHSTNTSENLEDEVQAFNNTDTKTTNELTINFLGEVMMGGNVTNNLEYNYSSSIKDIYSTVRQADFTYCNFSTNITNLEKIENAKSKYLVTSNIFNALEALGIDAVSIASDHIVDYQSDVLKNTISLLEKNEIFVAGRKDMPVYFEKDNKKIAIISTNSVIIGTAKNYTSNDISIYSKENLKKNIDEAKQSADIVIVDFHWGRDHIYGLTDQMREYAKTAIDLGADMIIGSHALGVYPIVKYKDKPIIYSLGYFMSDLDYTVAKKSFVFKLKISAQNKISSLEMIPIYIENKKYVRLYSEYDSEECNNFLEQFNGWNVENGIDSKVSDNKILVVF